MKVLVVVDMQNDFVSGPLGTPDARYIVPNVQKKVERAVKNGDIIVYTRDTHFTDYLDTKEGKKLPVEHCIYRTPGWNIIDEVLAPFAYENAYVFDKATFGYKKLPAKIKKILEDSGKWTECDEIELVGLCTDICVVSNALLLKSEFYEDFEISVDATCCAGVSTKTHEAALKTMECCQIVVKRG